MTQAGQEEKIFSVLDYGADASGRQLTTEAFQAAVEAAAAVQGEVSVPAGQYLLGSVFLHSHMTFHLETGAVLLGSEELADYPQIATRVAGIEMSWPAALLNILDSEDVTICGAGTLDGRGEKWWHEYWGEDGKGGRRAEYDARDLRWVADYEIQRPRLLLVQNSHDVHLQDFTARRSGFWTVQLTYCHDVTVRGLTIRDNEGPSTDGIDIDSCEDVDIDHCTVACNDDDIVIKSGRDADGLRVNRPCRRVCVHNCDIRSGAGITIGSEVSGGIESVEIRDCRFTATDCGFRIKSSRLRGGYIRHIHVSGLTMHDVRFPFSWLLDWHPAYNTFILPEGEIPEYWRRLSAPVPEEKQYTAIDDVLVEHVTATYDSDYAYSARALDLQGAVTKPMTGIVFRDVKMDTQEFGTITAVDGLKFDGVTVSARQGNQGENDTYDQR
ncbi:MAG: glycosyl hydrolase family 28 protein [Selenomonadaceae bacterium]|nr:glycosyl hydrolase family 28 protein [Selenomonadaceae bacterium]MDY3917362.1 glycosyl hydrolase family 28 protein [Selenomonadaceae bacterium]